MKEEIALKVENLSKTYRLGEIGTGTISHDLNRWWSKIRGKEDPYATVGMLNDRTQQATKGEYVKVLDDINFEVKKGEILGVIGKNGAGKSTLLKVISQITSPSSGSIKAKGRIASLLEVGTGMHPEMTGKENVYLNGTILGMTKKEIDLKFDEIMDFAGCAKYANTPVKRYSSGMMVRLGFAVAAFLEPEILIVDEVLAVGDAEFQKKAIGKMQAITKGDGRTVLFVSHNMGSISKLCTSALFLSNGQIALNSNVTEAVQMYLKSDIEGNTFKNDFIKNLEVRQVNQHIELCLEYNYNNIIDTPIFGFVVKNNQGAPIFGSNPLIDNIDFNNYIPKKQGKVNVKIQNPKLIDGEYYFSIWFGDSKGNFFSQEDCLRLETAGMSTQKQFDPIKVGNVLPNCEWSFQ